MGDVNNPYMLKYQIVNVHIFITDSMFYIVSVVYMY